MTDTNMRPWVVELHGRTYWARPRTWTWQQAARAGHLYWYDGTTWQPYAAPAAGTVLASSDQYEPGSAQARALFRRAAQLVGLPESWADSDGLHYVLDRESSGWVGRPNYTYSRVKGDGFHRPAQRARWPEVWAELRAGTVTARSSATGLGQLLLSNVERYYPSGRAGIGDPLQEAAGMLKYIERRYDNPDIAGRYYRMEKCEDIGIDPDTYRYSNGDVGVRYSKRAMREFGGPGCKPGGGY